MNPLKTKLYKDSLRELLYKYRHILAAIFVGAVFILAMMKYGFETLSQYFRNHITQTGIADTETSKIIRRRAVAGETYNPDADHSNEVVKHNKTNAQRANLEGHLKNIVFFQNLEPEQFTHILDAFFLKKVTANEYIIKQGDEGDYFYVIEKGSFIVFVEENGEQKVIQTYNESGSFGELALLYSIPRAASVKAEADGLIWALDRKTFRRIIVKAAHKNRKVYDELIKNVKILSHLNEMQRLKLTDALVQKNFTDGQVIMKEGQDADGMYFVISGQVSIYKKVHGKRVPLKVIEKGSYFGELALLTKGKRAATAVAKGKATTAFLDADAFVRLLGPCEEAMRANIQKYKIKQENIV